MEGQTRRAREAISSAVSPGGVITPPPGVPRPSGQEAGPDLSMATRSARAPGTGEHWVSPEEAIDERSRRGRRVSVVIPTLNENGNVSKLITRIEGLFPLEPEIIVVDDGSSDGTVESVLALRETFQRIHVIERGVRGGIGSAVGDGIRFALDKTESDHVVTMDADWSHDPTELPALLEAALDADFVQGSRYAEGGRIVGWPPMRRVLSIVGNGACRILFKTGLREHTTFYRVFSRACAQVIVENVRDDGYAWGVRSLLVARDAGFKACEVPITFVERTSGESKLGFREMVGWFFSIARLLGQRPRRS